MKHFRKIIILFNYFCNKTPSETFGRVLNTCQVLNMSEFWIFLSFRKYDRVLSMGRNAIMEGLWIFQHSKYARVLCMQALRKVLNMPRQRFILFYISLLSKYSRAQNIAMLSIARVTQGAKYAWVSLGLS